MAEWRCPLGHRAGEYWDPFAGRLCKRCSTVMVLAPNGEAGKREGMARAERGRSTAWKDQARRAIRLTAERRETLTTDDVLTTMVELGADIEGETRALGALMRQAGKAGLIEPTSEYRLSDHDACHRRPKRVWRSLMIHGGA